MNRYGVKYLLPVFLWMLLIFISSSIPQDDFPQVEFWGWAKLIHLIYYGTLCFLVQRAVTNQGRYPLLARHSYLVSVISVVLYGASDEFHQLSTPGRHGQFTDVIIDTVGAFLFILGYWAYRSFRQGRTEEAGGG